MTHEECHPERSKGSPYFARSATTPWGKAASPTTKAHTITHFSPNAALLLLTAGILLIYVELNRPGLILPGALGLTVTLLAAARFFALGTSANALIACLFGFALLAASTRTRTHLPLAVGATAALVYAFLHLGSASFATRPGERIAVLCAVFLGVGTSLLTTIAARARQNKGLDLK